MPKVQPEEQKMSMEKQYTYNLTALSNVILHTQQYNLFLILIFFLSKFVFILLLLI